MLLTILLGLLHFFVFDSLCAESSKLNCLIYTLGLERFLAHVQRVMSGLIETRFNLAWLSSSIVVILILA